MGNTPVPAPTMAMNVESIRARMMARIQVPEDLVNEALRVTRAKLQAKSTKFFSHHGEVTDEREVEDHETQLKAADQIFSLAGLYTRDKESKPARDEITIEVGADGVVRLRVGAPVPVALPETVIDVEATHENHTSNVPTSEPVGKALLPPAPPPPVQVAVQTEELEHIKVHYRRDTPLPENIRKILFEDG